MNKEYSLRLSPRLEKIKEMRDDGKTIKEIAYHFDAPVSRISKIWSNIETKLFVEASIGKCIEEIIHETGDNMEIAVNDLFNYAERLKDYGLRFDTHSKEIFVGNFTCHQCGNETTDLDIERVEKYLKDEGFKNLANALQRCRERK